MRVLYVLWRYPKLSETYIATEIDFMRRNGVTVEVWSPNEEAGVRPEVFVHRGGFMEAAKAFRPDLVHIHYFTPHRDVAAEAEILGLPVTVRGHSFDFNIPVINSFLKAEHVRRVYLFPHFARLVAHYDKVMALPVAFDPTFFTPMSFEEKVRKAVLRTAAAKRTKGLEDFYEAAGICRDFHFTLIVNDTEGGYAEELELKSTVTPGGVLLRRNVPNRIIASYVRKAGIYMDTSNPAKQPFGMPVSIAEAMATGSVVLVRKAAGAEEFVGDGALLYEDVKDAAGIIKDTAKWSSGKWDALAGRASERSRLFEANRVLPAMLEDWKGIVKG